MKINVEIVSYSLINDAVKIENLNEKELVPKMMIRRRLSRSSKIFIYLASETGFKTGNVVYGSAYGELIDSVSILESINNKTIVSPSSFQNSVYNTAASYHSIISGNKSEISTISSGDNTSHTIMKEAGLVLQRVDEVFVCSIEAMNFKGVEKINRCDNDLEYGIAFVLRKTNDKATLVVDSISELCVPKSLEWMKSLYDLCRKDKRNIVEIEL